MKKIDVLLVHPSNRVDTYQRLGSEFASVEPPVWAGMLATFLHKKGLEVRILDTNAEGLGYADAADIVKQISPVLVAVVCYGQQPSASTLVMPGAGQLAINIKEIMPEQPILFIGGHVAALPERTLQEEACDFVCDGEGPYTLHELVLALKSRSPDFSKVRGLLYRLDGKIFRNASAPLVMDLDNEMPGVAWDLLPVEKYVAHNWHCFGRLDSRNSYASMYTSLGCPFSCDFCCIHAPFKHGQDVLGLKNKSAYRLFSPTSVLDQLDILVNKYGITNIKFADELFVYNTTHVKNICEQIVSKGYDLNIWAYVRVDTWTHEMLELMRKAGIRWLAPGIESGSQRVRADMHKNFKQDNAVMAIEAFRQHEIHTIGNFLVGLPEDDLCTMRETLDFAKELNCEFFNFYCAMAYPGSKLYQRAIGENLSLPATWNGYSQHAYDTLPLPTKYISGQEVLKFRDAGWLEYFTNPTYLQMIEQKFGASTKEHIERMTSYTLPRKYVS